MRVRSNICYQINYTLMGRQLLIGIKDENSFVKYSKKNMQDVITFIDKYKEEEIVEEKLSEEEKILCANFNKLGYLNNGIEAKKSFNEFKTIGKIFFKLHPKNCKSVGVGSKRVGLALFITSILLLVSVIGIYNEYLPKKIDYIHMKIWEILFTILVFPPSVLALHELGHCIMARYCGAKIESVSLGWFFIYPIVLVQYYGLNLEAQRKKIMVMAGGVYMNLFMATIGILLKSIWPHVFYGAVIDIWISAHISTIITNLGLFGMTDGYFIFSMILGVMDLRMKGYRFINQVLKKEKKSLDYTYKVCGIVLLGLYLNGIFNLFIQINYISSLFVISHILMYVAFGFAIVTLTYRFLVRVKMGF